MLAKPWDWGWSKTPAGWRRPQEHQGTLFNAEAWRSSVPSYTQTRAETQALAAAGQTSPANWKKPWREVAKEKQLA